MAKISGSSALKPRRLPVLLRRAWYALNQGFRQRAAHLGLTPDQFSILRWLTEGDPAGLTQREITKLMASDPNTITSTLNRMERAGFIARQPHERDRRAKRVLLRPLGAETFAKAQEVALELQGEVLKALPEDRRDSFLEDLDAIGQACADALERPPRRARKPEEAAR
jgi:DNA-binding MarR family transcriptional regulator